VVPGVQRDRAGGADDLAAERAAPDVSVLVKFLADGRDAEAQQFSRHSDRRAAERCHDVASAVFATPEIGTVGLTEAEAQRRFEAVDVYLVNFRPMKATLGGGAERAIMKLVVDAGSDRVVGVHILAHDAAEMIQVAAIAIKMAATKADFDATMALHPTAAEEPVTMRSPTRRHRRAAS
jgi:glutathione reductase (NADPH)